MIGFHTESLIVKQLDWFSGLTSGFVFSITKARVDVTNSRSGFHQHSTFQATNSLHGLWYHLRLGMKRLCNGYRIHQYFLITVQLADIMRKVASFLSIHSFMIPFIRFAVIWSVIRNLLLSLCGNVSLCVAFLYNDKGYASQMMHFSIKWSVQEL